MSADINFSSKHKQEMSGDLMGILKVHHLLTNWNSIRLNRCHGSVSREVYMEREKLLLSSKYGKI